MKARMAVAALALVGISSTAQAQGGYWWGGLGWSTPTGDASGVIGGGLLGTAGVGWNLGSARDWSLQVEGMMGKNPGKGTSDDIELLGLMANLAYDINPAETMHPFLYGGLGIASSKAKDGVAATDMALQAGGGLSWKLNDVMNLWADVRVLHVMSASRLTYIPVTAGFSIPFGTP
jgi:opacity protein-like surface antigen